MEGNKRVPRPARNETMHLGEIVTDPVLVEVFRGEIVESVHRGAVAVFDAAGKAVLELGDTERPVFPRSAVKAIQALPLVESGAADAFGFGAGTGAGLASHGGEPAHVELAASMLGRAGMDETALECGAALAGPFRCDAGAGALRQDATTAQQLLRQALRFPLHLPASRHRPSGYVAAAIARRTWCARPWRR